MRDDNKEIQCLYLKNPPTLAKSVKNALFETPSRAMHLIQLLTLEEGFAFAIKPSRKTFYEVFLGMLNQ